MVVAVIHVRYSLLESNHLCGATAEKGRGAPNLTKTGAAATKQDESKSLVLRSDKGCENESVAQVTPRN